MKRFLALLLLVSSAAWGAKHPPDIVSAALYTCDATKEGRILMLSDADAHDDCDTSGGGDATAFCKCEQTGPSTYAWAGVLDFVAGADLDADGGISDNAVGLAQMAGGTDGNVITYDANGDPAAVPTGTTGQVLTSNGVGAAPTMQTLPEGLSGLTSIWVGAGAMIPRTTNGSSALQTRENATNDVMDDYLEFDASAEEGVQFDLVIPSWDEGTIIATFHWDGAATATGTRPWDIACQSYADGDPIDTAFPSPTEVTDTITTVGDEHISAATAAVTVANTPSDGDKVKCEITGPTTGSIAVDSLLFGVSIGYTSELGGGTDSVIYTWGATCGDQASRYSGGIVCNSAELDSAPLPIVRDGTLKNLYCSAADSGTMDSGDGYQWTVRYDATGLDAGAGFVSTSITCASATGASPLAYECEDISNTQAVVAGSVFNWFTERVNFPDATEMACSVELEYD